MLETCHCSDGFEVERNAKLVAQGSITWQLRKRQE